jgi:23S rRNA pseudouridine2605 synthase
MSSHPHRRGGPTRRPPSDRRSSPASRAAVSLPRALSKLGFCSRTEATLLIEARRVSVNGRIVDSVTRRVDPSADAIAVDGKAIAAEAKQYLMLNKPRGLVTTRHDPKDRGTVYDCLPASLPYLAPVGRLDKASEGLLLFTNDARWADHLLSPASGVPKTYHVKIDRSVDADFATRLMTPVEDDGERLSAEAVSLLRAGPRSSWIEIVLTEGRNRQVRRMMAAHDAGVLRLVRVRIGTLALDDLGKGQTRLLTDMECNRIWSPGRQAALRPPDR